jgi:hypothetical protein
MRVTMQLGATCPDELDGLEAALVWDGVDRLVPGGVAWGVWDLTDDFTVIAGFIHQRLASLGAKPCAGCGADTKSGEAWELPGGAVCGPCFAAGAASDGITGVAG